MFLPDNIDFAESKKYILSIRLLPNGFYFSIHCPSDETVFYQNSVTFRPESDYLKNIEKLIFDYSFFSYNYKQINVICVDNQVTIVPNKFHTKNSEADIFSFNWLNAKSHVLSNEIKELNCKIVWAMDTAIHDFLCRTLLNPRFVSHLAMLVPLFHGLHSNNNIATSTLFVNFNDDKMIDVVAFSGEKLMLAKTFCTQNPLEDSYYIQKTWEVLQFNVLSDILKFSGKTENHSECIETLKKVVSKANNVSFKLPGNTNIKQEEIPTEILN